MVIFDLLRLKSGDNRSILTFRVCGRGNASGFKARCTSPIQCNFATLKGFGLN